jgi:hypothetical protein
MREGFEPEPNFEPQCRKILPKFKKSFYFRYYLIDGNVMLFVTNWKARHYQNGYSGLTNRDYIIFGCCEYTAIWQSCAGQGCRGF